MPAIIASAPGKIIIFGEHAVVYGRPAIAVPVTQVQAKTIVTAQPGWPTGKVQVQAPNIHLEADLEELPEDNPLAAVIRGVAKALNLPRFPACTVRITSTIPVAAGLGSGAAVSVATIRALSAFLGHPLLDQTVSELAFESEKIHHGTPSGIDNSVITYAMPVYFVRGQPMVTFRVSEPFTLLIGDTGISSPTALTVGDVRRLWQSAPDRYDQIFDQIGEIAQSARQVLENGDLHQLGALMTANHQYLQQLQVSSLELDRLVEAASEAGALGAKLSGGGRGGNMIALVDEEKVQDVSEALAASGATRVIATEVKTKG